jgi:phage FluMu protein Com
MGEEGIVMHTGKCPHCEKTIASAEVETISIKAGTQASYKGVSYLCPHCRAVLSVSMDQLALIEETKKRLLQAMGRG